MKLLDKFVLKQKWLLLLVVLIATAATATTALYSPPDNADSEALRKQKAKIELKKSQGQTGQNVSLRGDVPTAINITKGTGFEAGTIAIGDGTLVERVFTFTAAPTETGAAFANYEFVMTGLPATVTYAPATTTAGTGHTLTFANDYAGGNITATLTHVEKPFVTVKAADNLIETINSVSSDITTNGTPVHVTRADAPAIEQFTIPVALVSGSTTAGGAWTITGTETYTYVSASTATDEITALAGEPYFYVTGTHPSYTITVVDLDVTAYTPGTESDEITVTYTSPTAIPEITITKGTGFANGTIAKADGTVNGRVWTFTAAPTETGAAFANFEFKFAAALPTGVTYTPATTTAGTGHTLTFANDYAGGNITATLTHVEKPFVTVNTVADQTTIAKINDETASTSILSPAVKAYVTRGVTIGDGTKDVYTFTVTISGDIGGTWTVTGATAVTTEAALLAATTPSYLVSAPAEKVYTFKVAGVTEAAVGTASQAITVAYAPASVEPGAVPTTITITKGTGFEAGDAIGIGTGGNFGTEATARVFTFTAAPTETSNENYEFKFAADLPTGVTYTPAATSAGTGHTLTFANNYNGDATLTATLTHVEKPLVKVDVAAEDQVTIAEINSVAVDFGTATNVYVTRGTIDTYSFTVTLDDAEAATGGTWTLNDGTSDLDEVADAAALTGDAEFYVEENVAFADDNLIYDITVAGVTTTNSTGTPLALAVSYANPPKVELEVGLDESDIALDITLEPEEGYASAATGGSFIFTATLGDGLDAGGTFSVLTDAELDLIEVTESSSLKATAAPKEGKTYTITVENIGTEDLNLTVGYTPGEAVAIGSITLSPGTGLEASDINDGTTTATVTDGAAEFTVTPATTLEDDTIVLKVGDLVLTEETSPAIDEITLDDGVYTVKLTNITVTGLTVTVIYEGLADGTTIALAVDEDGQDAKLYATAASLTDEVSTADLTNGQATFYVKPTDALINDTVIVTLTPELDDVEVAAERDITNGGFNVTVEGVKNTDPTVTATVKYIGDKLKDVDGTFTVVGEGGIQLPSLTTITLVTAGEASFDVKKPVDVLLDDTIIVYNGTTELDETTIPAISVSTYDENNGWTVTLNNVLDTLTTVTVQYTGEPVPGGLPTVTLSTGFTAGTVAVSEGDVDGTYTFTATPTTTIPGYEFEFEYAYDGEPITDTQLASGGTYEGLEAVPGDNYLVTLTVPNAITDVTKLAVTVTYVDPLYTGTITLNAGTNLTDDVTVTVTAGTGTFTIAPTVPGGTFDYTPSGLFTFGGDWNVNATDFDGTVSGVTASKATTAVTVNYTLPAFVTVNAPEYVTFEPALVPVDGADGVYTLNGEISLTATVRENVDDAENELVVTYNPAAETSSANLVGEGVYTVTATGINSATTATVSYVAKPRPTIQSSTNGVTVGTVAISGATYTSTATVTVQDGFELRFNAPTGVDVQFGEITEEAGTAQTVSVTISVDASIANVADVNVVVSYIAIPSVTATGGSITGNIRYIATTENGTTTNIFRVAAPGGNLMFYAVLNENTETGGTISVTSGGTELIGNGVTAEPNEEGTTYTINVTGITSPLTVVVSYVARPTVTVNATNVAVSTTQGPANTNESFSFTATLTDDQSKLPNGKFDISFDPEYYDITEEVDGETVTTRYAPSYGGYSSNGTSYTHYVYGIKKATTVNVSYDILSLTYSVTADSDTTFTGGSRYLVSSRTTDNGIITLTATLSDDVNAGGVFTYAYNGYNVENVKAEATLVANTTKTYNFKFTLPAGNRGIDNLDVEIAYLPAAPAVIPEPTPGFQKPSISIDGIGEGEIATSNKPTSRPPATDAIGRNNYDLLTDYWNDYYDKGSVVPGGKIEDNNVSIPTTYVSPTPQTVTFTFSGALASITPSVTVYNVLINVAYVNIVYIFDSSVKSTSFGVGTRAASDGSIVIDYDAATHTFYVHLIGIDVDALKADETITFITLYDDEEEEYQVQASRAITLYDEPITLIPDNGVPSIGYSGYFTLGGTYPTDGQLLYKLENDANYKAYTTGLLNSEIARLANGELLYFALAGVPEAVSGIVIYKPKTYENVGGGDGGSYIPSLPRNVFISATASSEGLINFNPGSGQGITTDGNFQFTVIPETVIPGYEVALHFYKDWITVDADYQPVYDIVPNADGSFTVTLTNIKVSDLQIVVEYRQGTVGNANVDADKVWANGKTLFINSNTNGTAKVYSIAGGLVKTVKVDANTLTSTELPAGTYIVTLNGKSSKVNTK
jgi:hypothetical protein